MAAHPGAARAVRRPVNCLAMTRHRLPLRLALLGVLVMMLRCGMSSAALSSSSVCSSEVLPCTRKGRAALIGPGATKRIAAKPHGVYWAAVMKTC